MAKLNMVLNLVVKFKQPAKLLSSSLPVSPSRVLRAPGTSPYHLVAEAPSGHVEQPAKLLSSSLPVSPSRVLRAPGTSPYHLVPKHLRATWPRPEQSHLLPEACSPNGTDNRRQRQRQTERPPPEPSDILKRFHSLNYLERRYFMKKVSKL